MFSTQEKLELKAMVLKEMHKLILELGQKEDYDKKKLVYLVRYAHKNLQGSQRLSSIERHLNEMCQTESKVQTILKKFKNHKDELVQKVTQECLECLMDQNPDRWMELSEDSSKLTEEKFRTWVANLSVNEIKELQKQLKPKSNV